MSLFESILFGIIQGLTEFLPISSTAHLTLSGRLMSVIDAAHPERWTAFIAVIQLGTLVAILAYFFTDIIGIVKGFLTDGCRYLQNPSRGLGQARLGWLIIIGTIPVVVFGLAFKGVIEGSLTKNLEVIGSSLSVLALIMWIAEAVGKRARTVDDATWWDALIVGCAQALALIPGSSRSGTTITAALFVGMKREPAARFSFLLSIPAVLASGMLELYEMRGFMGAIGGINVLVATLASAVVGYLSIDFLLRYLRTRTMWIFIVYRVVAGSVLWILLLRGVIQP